MDINWKKGLFITTLILLALSFLADSSTSVLFFGLIAVMMCVKDWV